MLGIRSHHSCASACLLHFWKSVHSYVLITLQKRFSLLQLRVNSKLLKKSELSRYSLIFLKAYEQLTFLKALSTQLESLFRDSEDRFFLFVSFLTAQQCDLHIPWVSDVKNTFSCEIKNLMLALQDSYRQLSKLVFASFLVK